MTPPLFLLDQLPPGEVVVLDGDEGRHAATVRRVRPGEDVLVGDGRGTLLACQVQRVLPGSVELAVLSRREVAPSSPRLTVVQALPKGDRGELAVELLTELGADEIVPWAALRAVTRWDGERGHKAWTRWQRTAREATKQSRRPWVPVVAQLASTAEVEARLREAGTALVLHEQASAAIASVALSGAEVILVVGPEGGVSPQEQAGFEVAGAVAVRLGETVLRTSTAGAAALAALNLRLGRWA